MPSLDVRPFQEADYCALAAETGMAAGSVPGSVAACGYGPAFTAFVDGERAACAGVVLAPYAGVGDAWALLGPLGVRHGVFVTRAVRRGLHAIVRRHQLIRVDAEVLAPCAGARRWVQWLGFVEEGVMVRRGPGGVDMIRYALLPKAGA